LRTLSKTLMKSTVFWDIMRCSPLEVNWQQSSSCCLLHAGFWFLARLILRPWRWRWHVPLQRRLTFNRLPTHCCIPEDSTLHNHCFENPKSYVNELLGSIKCWEIFWVAGKLVSSQQGLNSMELVS
jgi:hypothetical protein